MNPVYKIPFVSGPFTAVGKHRITWLAEKIFGFWLIQMQEIKKIIKTMFNTKITKVVIRSKCTERASPFRKWCLSPCQSWSLTKRWCCFEMSTSENHEEYSEVHIEYIFVRLELFARWLADDMRCIKVYRHRIIEGRISEMSTQELVTVGIAMTFIDAYPAIIKRDTGRWRTNPLVKSGRLNWDFHLRYLYW